MITLSVTQDFASDSSQMNKEEKQFSMFTNFRSDFINLDFLTGFFD